VLHLDASSLAACPLLMPARLTGARQPPAASGRHVVRSGVAAAAMRKQQHHRRPASASLEWMQARQVGAASWGVGERGKPRYGWACRTAARPAVQRRTHNGAAVVRSVLGSCRGCCRRPPGHTPGSTAQPDIVQQKRSPGGQHRTRRPAGGHESAHVLEALGEVVAGGRAGGGGGGGTHIALQPLKVAS
jgi:hypothetical protein